MWIFPLADCLVAVNTVQHPSLDAALDYPPSDGDEDSLRYAKRALYYSKRALLNLKRFVLSAHKSPTDVSGA